ncbi:MAG: hypothetical protein K9J25_10715 [Bacteroidales bacterium]|nr:hypothetical protein [Bacteroidales bacterium]
MFYICEDISFRVIIMYFLLLMEWWNDGFSPSLKLRRAGSRGQGGRYKKQVRKIQVSCAGM